MIIYFFHLLLTQAEAPIQISEALKYLPLWDRLFTATKLERLESAS